ncbi:MAG: substrate-binding domain-containing protein [Phycisphaerae bacterium]
MTRQNKSQIRRFRVVVRISRGNHYGMGLLRGIAAFAQAQTAWEFPEDPSHASQTPEALDAADCDGVLIYTTRWADVERLRMLGIPVVNTTSRVLGHSCARVCADNAAVGSAGAHHLLGLGLRRFAYLCRKGPSIDRDRANAFVKVVHKEGGNVVDLPEYVDPSSIPELAGALAWQDGALGLMCANDRVAMHMLRYLCQIGCDVPDSVAVLGCDNDELTCAFANPTLSSVDIGAFQIGYRAAQLLQELMARQKCGTPEILLKPAGVVQRGSTRTIHVDDPCLAAAIRFVREHACKGIRVSDVLGQVPMSRRSLERGFREALGRTPMQEIRRLQMQAATEMLASGEDPIYLVAERCGLGDQRYFSQVFRGYIGQTPSQYRRAHRQATDPTDLRALPRLSGPQWTTGFS